MFLNLIFLLNVCIVWNTVNHLNVRPIIINNQHVHTLHTYRTCRAFLRFRRRRRQRPRRPYYAAVIRRRSSRRHVSVACARCIAARVRTAVERCCRHRHQTRRCTVRPTQNWRPGRNVARRKKVRDIDYIRYFLPYIGVGIFWHLKFTAPHDNYHLKRIV